jgi:hypothetical protein
MSSADGPVTLRLRVPDAGDGGHHRPALCSGPPDDPGSANLVGFCACGTWLAYVWYRAHTLSVDRQAVNRCTP